MEFHSDTGWPSDTASSKPPSPPSGPMTTSRAKALQLEVNSLFSTCDFDSSLDGILHANTLCVIRYNPRGAISKSQCFKTEDAREGPTNKGRRSTAASIGPWSGLDRRPSSVLVHPWCGPFPRAVRPALAPIATLVQNFAFGLVTFSKLTPSPLALYKASSGSDLRLDKN
jgi:hypothetical protein